MHLDPKLPQLLEDLVHFFGWRLAALASAPDAHAHDIVHSANRSAASAVAHTATVTTLIPAVPVAAADTKAASPTTAAAEGSSYLRHCDGMLRRSGEHPLLVLMRSVAEDDDCFLSRALCHVALHCRTPQGYSLFWQTHQADTSRCENLWMRPIC